MAKRTRTVGPAPKLPDAELDVMTYLWRHGPTTVRQIREGIADIRPMAPGSVITLLKRLEAKKLVSREKAKQGKAHVYRATRPAEPTYYRLVRNMADRVFAGNSTALIATLFESRKPTADELEQLQQLVDRLRADQHEEESS